MYWDNLILRNCPELSLTHDELVHQLFEGDSHGARGQAAWWLAGRFRSKKTLALLIEAYRTTDWELSNCTDRNRHSLHLCAIGRLDFKAGHDFLIQLGETTFIPKVLADALEAVTYGRSFDFTKFVLKHLRVEADSEVTLGALYALLFTKWVLREPKTALETLGPFLTHPTSSIREYSVENLYIHPNARELLVPFIKDPDEAVAETARRFLEH